MTIWRGRDPLVLASQSRARQMLLGNAGIGFEAVPAGVDERAIQQKSGLLKPGEIAALLAQEKALFISAKMPDRYVVGADQTLALDQRLFSKPAGRAATMALLKRLNSEFKKTLIMVTHDPKTAGCAEQVLHLEKGQLVEHAVVAAAKE